ncbi:MAG: hypothetical protein HOH64_13665 [Rhodospirillales bacterium]|jgi:hypothetical protein|nr:hypothetical protein [Rhodospirillales bacterium]MBT5351744.1 hypothetical protein [Rhodospirillales bacterium]MBT6111135.1 hypothetical protein [Rhodospirillales bacterium]MBT6825265.1 hypothetical protein [Rhodospirillales bacterium]MBT7146978.1 hypothetical protein [Rhodospirillales bacterium]
MLARFGRAMYWIGLVFGGFFLMLNVVPLSVMIGLLEGAENGKPWIGMVIVSVIGFGIWGTGWVIRYFTTGATGINPKDRGWYTDVK